MSFATKMQAVASNLLTSFGQSVTFSRTIQGTFVPSTGAVGAGTATTYTALVQPSQYTSLEINNVSVLAGDVKLTCYSTTPVLVGDTVSLDGIVYRVENVIKVNAQGTNIIYTVQIRL